ncbi:MAG: hypothetical protein IH877_07535 [Gemmatimonadetes bacterium]|nr:hypothetical protein [Gemmatimonadota bacterium]
MIVKQVRDRIGFKEVKFEELPNNRCEALVDLAWPEGDVFIGTAQGKDSESGRLKCTVEATARALEQSVNDQIELEVQGVQTITVSDTIIIVVVLSYRLLGETQQQLVGSCIIGRQLERSAALAALKATNRLMGNVLFRGSA